MKINIADERIISVLSNALTPKRKLGYKFVDNVRCAVHRGTSEAFTVVADSIR